MTKPSRNETTATINIESFEITRAHMFENGQVTFDMVLNGISLYGLKVVEYERGDFIGFPQRKGSDGKYYSIFWCRLSDKDTKAIIKEVAKMLD